MKGRNGFGNTTGIITVGKPSVVKTSPDGVTSNERLSFAASLEERSKHPFAKTIMKIIQKYSKAEGFSVLPGQRVSAIISKESFYGGNAVLL